MLGSISLLGERARGRRWIVTATALAIGATAAGSALGFVFGAAGSVLPLDATARVELELALVAAAAAVDAVWLPRRAGPIRQVNDQWLAVYRGWVAGSGFGVQLGLAVVTVVTSATTYVFLGSMLLVGSVSAAVLIGFTYGAMRAVGAFFGGVIRTPRDLARADAVLASTDSLARWSVVATSVVWVAAALFLLERS